MTKPDLAIIQASLALSRVNSERDARNAQAARTTAEDSRYWWGCEECGKVWQTDATEPDKPHYCVQCGSDHEVVGVKMGA